MEKRRLNCSLDLIQNYLYGKKCNVARLPSEKLPLKPIHMEPYRAQHELGEQMPLPKQIEIGPSTIPGEKLGVFSTMWIKEGTQMGPYTGRVMPIDKLDMKQLNNFVWEMFDECGRITHFIDGMEDLHQNWLCHVRCARFDQEQNLEVVQIKDKIFYRAIKDVPPNQELLVWYGLTTHQFLGIPLSSHFEEVTGKKRTDGKALSGVMQSMMFTSNPSPGRLRCTVCRRGFNSRSNLRSHMRIHTLEKPFECQYCKKSFSQSSTLRNHTRLHTGEKPYNCTVCDMAYSQLAGLRAHQKSARHRPHGTVPSDGMEISPTCRKNGCTQFPYSDEARSLIWTNRTQDNPIEIAN